MGNSGRSQQKMGEACDLHWAYIGQVEHGERNLALHSIEKIALGFKITVSKLMRGV